MTECTQTCSKVIHIVKTQIDVVNECLDGKNVANVLKDFGIKYHKCIYDHVLRFEYNEFGAMALVRDLNEYRQSAKSFKSILVESLFTTLYSLANVLVVAPENLQEICSGENLASLNKDIIESFVKLRADNKLIKFQINRANRNV